MQETIYLDLAKRAGITIVNKAKKQSNKNIESQNTLGSNLPSGIKFKSESDPPFHFEPFWNVEEANISLEFLMVKNQNLPYLDKRESSPALNFLRIE